MELIEQMNRWTKVQREHIVLEDGRLVNRETGEIMAEQDFDNQAYLRFVSNVEKTVPQYSHKVDRKPNRQLYDANITATKIIDGKRYIIKEYKDIYGDNGKELKKKIVKEPEKLLTYHHDHKTFKKFEEIVKNYYNEPNPFAAYKEDKQCAIRKYSRKDNGPEIHDVKYISREAEGNFEDPKHKTSIREKTKSLRSDIYQDRTGYKFMRVPYHMIQRIENPETRKVSETQVSENSL